MGLLDRLSSLLPGRKRAPNNPENLASFFPVWEQNTPHYPHPNPYALAMQSYRGNSLVFSCITTRSQSVGEAKLRILDTNQETPEELATHQVIELLHQPNERITEQIFWETTEINLLISGFACWEKERNRLGEVIRLWPMRSDFCSFKRGENRLLETVVYEPYGLPSTDLPAEDVLIFQYYDPIYPFLIGWSPTMAALGQIGVDNNTTEFLSRFFREGAVPAGLLKTQQTINDAEAERIRSRWRRQHGGVENWSDIAVLGSGTEYQATQMAFKDMGFGDVDSRSESRICSVYKIPPILVGAKIGLDRSTYSNYQEARKAYYEQAISGEWAMLAGQFTAQMLPAGSGLVAEFDTRNVKSLQEDRNAAVTRAMQGFTSNLMTRDEAREEIGLDPVDNAPIFSADLVDAGVMDMPMLPEEPALPAEPQTAEMVLEEKRFREFARRRVKEGKTAEIPLFDFKALPIDRRAELIGEVGGTSASPFRSEEIQ